MALTKKLVTHTINLAISTIGQHPQIMNKKIKVINKKKQQIINQSYEKFMPQPIIIYVDDQYFKKYIWKMYRITRGKNKKHFKDFYESYIEFKINPNNNTNYPDFIDIISEAILLNLNNQSFSAQKKSEFDLMFQDAIELQGIIGLSQIPPCTMNRMKFIPPPYKNYMFRFYQQHAPKLGCNPSSPMENRKKAPGGRFSMNDLAALTKVYDIIKKMRQLIGWLVQNKEQLKPKLFNNTDITHIIYHYLFPTYIKLLSMEQSGEYMLGMPRIQIPILAMSSKASLFKPPKQLQSSNLDNDTDIKEQSASPTNKHSI